MDRFMISDSETGPWLELQITNNPAHALQLGRGSFNWPVVWVAKMRPIRGEDLMPSEEVFQGEIMERIADHHGGQAADQLNDEAVFEVMWIEACDAITGHLLDVECDVWVPEIKKPYGKDQGVRVTDFLKPKPKLEEML